MSRLIDADKAYKVLTEYYHHTTDIQHDALKEALGKVPIVDAEPVRHGRWMKNGDRYCECSVCHHEGNMSGQDSYCWNCGANMDAPTQKSVDNALEALDEVEE